jgi:hypothetical protein
MDLSRQRLPQSPRVPLDGPDYPDKQTHRWPSGLYSPLGQRCVLAGPSGPRHGGPGRAVAVGRGSILRQPLEEESLATGL